VLGIPAALTAQARPASVIVRVSDSANAPVAGADVGIMRGTAETIAHGVSDASGRAMLAVPRVDGSLQLVARKIGFEREYRFFSISRDTVTLEITLRRSVALLDAVRVSADADLKRKSYHLTAEEIESSSRAIIDGSDIFKLRPDMMSSRGGPTACEVLYTPRTGWIESVWINGQRVTLAPVDSAFARGREAAYGLGPRPPRPNPRLSRSRAPTPPPPAFTEFSHMDSVLSILRLIKPEHIAEVTYHDCFDQSVGKNNSDLAMFIALKPGTGFNLARGSYVIDDTMSAAPVIDVRNLPRYRFRLLGAFDAESGDALANVAVTDWASGLRAATTATGTLALFFVPEGPAMLRLHKDGYQDTTVAITIAPSDTVPVTVIMTRATPPKRPRFGGAAPIHFDRPGGWPRG
jgi:hypothetical protein